MTGKRTIKKSRADGVVVERYAKRIIEAAFGNCSARMYLNRKRVSDGKHDILSVSVNDNADEVFDDRIVELLRLKFPCVRNSGCMGVGEPLYVASTLGIPVMEKCIDPKGFDPVVDASNIHGAFLHIQNQRAAEDGETSIYVKDYIVGPRSRSLFDMDAFAVAEATGGLVYFEIKQKYPYELNGGGIGFGLNTGEMRLIKDLAGRGIRCCLLFACIPFWSDSDRPPIEEVFREYGRCVAWLALPVYPNMPEPPVRVAPSKTGLYGNASVAFYELNCDMFRVIGTEDDRPNALAKNLLAVCSGAEDFAPQCSSLYLRSLRLPPVNRVDFPAPECTL